MIRVINFSGGSTSALMTILMKPTADDIVLFTDTGREHSGTYKFLQDFEDHENIKVHKAVYTHHKSPGLTGFDALTNWKTYLPNRTKRLCTDELKIKTAKRYLRNLGIRKFENFIGFRADEQSRVNGYKRRHVNVIPKFPLYEMGINKAAVDQFWLTKPYRLEIPRILGNCDLCFLKGKDAIIRILQVHPELAEKWIKDEKKSTFFKDVSYAQLLKAAQSQKTLWEQEDLNELSPAYNCHCNNF